jgi:hypothetical protein
MDSTHSLAERIRALDCATLSPIVQRATGCSGALTHWKAVKLRVIVMGMGPCLYYRFSGGIRGQAGEEPWSLFLKVTSPALPAKGPPILDPVTFRREFEFYRSDLSHRLLPGFRAAHSYAQSEQTHITGQPEFWVWLEDLEPFASNQWSMEDHYKSAVGVGKFNGYFLAGHPIPNEAWFIQDLYRNYLRRAEPAFQRLLAWRECPIIRRLLPPVELDSLLQLWRDRERHVALLARLPQTLCHGDAQYTNLFLVPDPSGEVETVAIDWSSVGLASIGTDPARMLTIGMKDPSTAAAFEQTLFQGYLAGLREAGCRLDPRLVRLGFTAASLRDRTFGILYLMSQFNEEGEIGETLRQQLQAQGISMEEWIDSGKWQIEFQRRLFEESLELRAQLF